VYIIIVLGESPIEAQVPVEKSS